MSALTFKQKTKIEETIAASDYESNLQKLVAQISRNCIDAENEATVVNIFDVSLFLFLRYHFKLEYYFQKEVAINTVRHVAKGKIDSKVGALVIEYKQPSRLRTTRDEERASSQLKNYLEGLYAAHEANYIGFITDGVRCKLIEMHFGKITEGAFGKLSTFHLDTIIKSIVLLDRVALTPENLIVDFCMPSENNLVKRLVQTLFGTLEHLQTERTNMLFNEWKELFKLAHDDTSKQQAILERSVSLEKVIGRKLRNKDEEYMVLYSLQTAYAIIIKIIAYKVISSAKFDDKFFAFNTYSESSDSHLMSVMQRMEDGAIFRDIGIGNLLEGDFFAWYCDMNQWNDEISQ